MPRTALLIALAISLPSLARAESQTPPPGTWALGWQGIGDTYSNGAPSVKYVATDKLSLELIPLVSYKYSEGPGSVETTNSYQVYVDVIRKIASYKGVNLGVIVEPTLGYTYDRTTSGGTVYKTEEPLFGAGAGLELEYFVRPNLSLGARAMLQYVYQGGTVNNSDFGSVGRKRVLSWSGQALNVHYYFTGPSANEAPAAPVGPGAWALGWQGVGAFGNSRPSLKYVLSDETALEAIPQLSYRSQSEWIGNFRDANYVLPVDVVRKIASRGPATLSYVVEPSVRYALTTTDYGSKSHDWYFGLGGGVELEYFVLPRLSVGTRALLVYTNQRHSADSSDGYDGLTISHSLALGGQVLSVRWYFGGQGR